MDFKNEVEAVNALSDSYHKLRNEIGKVIIGQEEVVKTVLISLFCDGHSLLVGVPGLAKTLLVNTISKALHLDFRRIQFTPDLMPSDITGSEVMDENRKFTFHKGPLFTNILLADEINRTPPKTQAALLESMQERIVTVAGHRYSLPDPFLVLATQNPIEQEGTYPLPEAQLDRFMFNVYLEYPSYKEEVDIVKRTTSGVSPKPEPVLSGEEIVFFQKLIREIPIADNVLEYAVGLVNKSRPNTEMATPFVNNYISWGAGPRASQCLVLGAKCHAAINGKYSPDIEDVQAITKYVMRHRVVRNYKAEAEGISINEVVKNLL